MANFSELTASLEASMNLSGTDELHGMASNDTDAVLAASRFNARGDASAFLAKRAFAASTRLMEAHALLAASGSVEGYAAMGHLLGDHTGKGGVVTVTHHVEPDALDSGALESALSDIGLSADRASPRLRRETAMEMARVLLGNTQSVNNFTAQQVGEIPSSVSGVERVETNLSATIGGDAMGAISGDSRATLSLAKESWGANTDVLNVDGRLTMTVAALRPQIGIADRAFARKSTDSTVQIVKTAQPIMYDLKKSQDASGAVRDGNHQVPLLDLWRDPELNTTEAKDVKLFASNDPTNQFLLADDILKAGVQFDLRDLSKEGAAIVHADYTDVISEGGQMLSVIVEAVKISDNTVELFEVPVDFKASSRFIAGSNVEDSADRVANPVVTFVLNRNEKTTAGAASALLATMTTGLVELTVNANVTISLRTGIGQSSISIAKGQLATDPDQGVEVSAADKTTFAGLRFTAIGFKVSLKHSEENLRRSTQMATIRYKQHSWELPVGPTRMVDYSLQQSEPADVVAALATMANIADSERSMRVMESTLKLVAARKDREKLFGNRMGFRDRLEYQFPAGALNKITVISESLDFSDIAVMRESERYADVQTRLKNFISVLEARLKQQTVMHRQYGEGENLVWKCFGSTQLVETILGISQYHEVYNKDGLAGATNGATFSFLLPNRDRVDIIATEYRRFDSRLVLVPVRERQVDDVMSFGTIFDMGTFVARFTKTGDANSSVTQRMISNSRSLLWPTNPVGIILDLVGLDDSILKGYQTPDDQPLVIS